FPRVTDFDLVSANQVLLQGTVTNRDTGQPIVGGTIHVYSGPSATVQTDANGHYAVTGLQYPYSNGQLFVEASGYYSKQNLTFSTMPATLNITLLPGGPALQGTVRDSATDVPIAG